MNKEQFNLHVKLLNSLYKEFSTLAKKQPDAFANEGKTKMTNKVLLSLKEILALEVSAQYLYLLDEVGDIETKGKRGSTYSDAVIILGQYQAACEEFRLKYFPAEFEIFN